MTPEQRAAILARDHGFLRGGAVGEPVRRLGDLSRRREPQRFLAALGQSELRAARRLLRRQRPVPAQLGHRAGIDPGRRRSGAAVQRARLPGLPPQGRARPPAGGAGRLRGLDVPAPVDPARERDRARRCSRAIGRTSSPSRPTAASCRISPFPATRPRGAWRSTTRRSRPRSRAARSCICAGPATGSRISLTGPCIPRSC